MVNKQQKRAAVIDVAIPSDTRHEKLEKSPGLNPQTPKCLVKDLSFEGIHGHPSGHVGN